MATGMTAATASTAAEPSGLTGADQLASPAGRSASRGGHHVNAPVILRAPLQHHRRARQQQPGQVFHLVTVEPDAATLDHAACLRGAGTQPGRPQRFGHRNPFSGRGQFEFANVVGNGIATEARLKILEHPARLLRAMEPAHQFLPEQHLDVARIAAGFHLAAPLRQRVQ